tara:strand:- start:1009 stop:1530 length:522 start_codon:yes stop_codon:yes gene_type:complete
VALRFDVDCVSFVILQIKGCAMNLVNFVTLDDNSEGFLPEDGSLGEPIIVPFMSFHANRLLEKTLPSHEIPVGVTLRQLEGSMTPGAVAMTETIGGITVYSVGVVKEITDSDVNKVSDTLSSLSPDGDWFFCSESNEIPGASIIMKSIEDSLGASSLSWELMKEKIKGVKGTA